ncbi:MAG: hypothetical protein AAF725_23705 [Acidobacteriota bacterium]
MKDIRLMPSLERWPRLDLLARVSRYSLQQLLEKRLWMFALVNTVFLARGWLAAVVSGSRLDQLYASSILNPSVLVGVPALAGAVAIERRSGSLDLALAATSTERFFLRRMLPLVIFLACQGVLVLTLGVFENAGSWSRTAWHLDVAAEYGRAVYQTLQLNFFLLAVSFFWAVRLRSTGSVAVASMITVILFWPWLSTSPKLAVAWSMMQGPFGLSKPLLGWIAQACVVGLASVLFYLYARVRVRRPETMLN